MNKSPVDEVYAFDCGCKIPIVNGHPRVDYYSLNLDCPKTWKIYQDGYTQSIFQLESYLGKNWSKKLKPKNIEDAAALVAIIRPSCLQSQDENGDSLTKVYCNRANNGWKPTEGNILDNLLVKTHGLNIFQETSMLLASEVAGFDGSQSMKLIKSIGKKLADLLFSLRKEFVAGCIKVGKVDEKEANAIFDNIESSARYAFNACALGTEKLKQASKGSNKFHASVEELYKITTDINYAKSTGHLSLYKKHKMHKCFGYALSMCEDGRIRKNKIKNIQEAGIRQCYILETESGKTCQITDNHKFPTPDGDKQLKDLVVGEEIYICGEYEKNDSRKYKFSNYTNSDLKTLRANGVGKTIHGNYSLYMKNSKKIRESKNCQTCNNTHRRLEIHHINGDRLNNSTSNLALLCPSCHKKEEYKVGRVKRGEKGYPRLTEKIKSITLGAIGMTYDITMEAPNHNYVTSSNIVSCNSHAVGYAVAGYWTAWAKAHLPKHYICAWLRNAKNEQKPLEEIRAVISEARRLKVRVLPPSIKNLPTTNFFIKNSNVYFGIDSIKGCGEKGVKKLIDLNIDFEDCSWLDFLVLYSDSVNKTQMVGMIRSGCFDYTGIDRSTCEHEYNHWIQLNNTEKIKAKAIHNQETPLTFTKLFDSILGVVTSKRLSSVEAIKDSLDNPPYSIYDSKENIIAHEKALMGINVSCSTTSLASVPDTRDNCKDVDGGNNNSTFILVGEITEYREIKIKNGKMAGQTMSSFQLLDESGSCDCVVFPKQLNLYEGSLYDGNVIMINGKKGNRGGLIIEEVFEI